MATNLQMAAGKSEFAFYDDVESIPTEEYTEETKRAIRDAGLVVEMAAGAIPPFPG